MNTIIMNKPKTDVDVSAHKLKNIFDIPKQMHDKFDRLYGEIRRIKAK